MGALTGTKVLDLTHHIAGPFCTKLLADHGADVLKIEQPPGGDPTRHMPPFLKDEPHPEKSGRFLYLNTGKRSVTLNLKTADGKHILKELVRDVDILVESFSPRVMPSLGMSYEVLRDINPRLIMTSISNFGQTGPYRDYKMTEIVLYAMALTMNGTGMADREPQKLAFNVTQYEAGTVAAIATLGAYLGREMHGVAQHVDVALVETQLSSIDRTATTVLAYQFSGENVGLRAGATPGFSILPAGVYPCRDGYVTFVAANPNWWPRFVRMVGRPELLEDPRFQDPAFSFVYNMDYKAEIETMVLEWLAGLTKQEAMEKSQAVEMAGTAINSMAEVFKDPQSNSRGFFVDIDHPIAGTLRYPGSPAQFTESPPQFRRAPLFGEHNREVYCDQLGYRPEDLVRLRALGVI